MSAKRIISVLVALVMVLSSVVSIKAVEPDSATMKIIDLSKWNSSINWSIVSKEVDGVIAQIGFRGSVYRQNIAEDEMFSSHMNGALQYGLHFGVYFYSLALTVEEAQEEAYWVINRLKAYNLKPDLPVYFDIEATQVRDSLNNRQRTDIAIAFCKVMSDNGYYAGVYSSRSWLMDLMYYNELNSYPVWVAEYNPSCNYKGKYGMWQYSDTGTVNGINGYVDLNTCYFDYPTFIKKYGYNGYTGIEEPPADTRDYSKRGTYKLTALTQVRAGASDSAATLGSVPSGSEVYVDFAFENWGMIPFSDSVGWINLKTASKKSDFVTTSKNLGYYIVNTDVLNVREGPSTEYSKVSELYYGTAVFIGGVENGWGYFYGGSGKRWICLDYAVFYGMVCFETGTKDKYIQPVKAKTGEIVSLPKWNISLADKVFSGWSLTSGGAVKYADNASVTIGDSNVILYAVCKSKSAYKFIKQPKEVKDGIMVIEEEGLTEAEFMKKYISLSEGFSYSMKRRAGTYIGTGSVITFIADGKNVSRLTVVVSGDCSGDALIDGIDLADALNVMQGAGSSLGYNEYQQKAADYNLDGKVDFADVNTIKNAAVGASDKQA